MQGAYDLHMHAAPSPFHRVLDDYGLLEEAGRAGMAGIMLKSHYESTIARAILANIHCASCTKAYGGLVLNWPVGGLNPYAVENAMKRGCRIVWMPTRDAKNSLCSGNMPGDFFDRSGISILTETGELRAEVLEILRIARKYDAAVATGHISPEESILLCQEGIRQGNRMVLTHPEFPRTRVDVKTQKQLAALGVYIEKCWYNVAQKECTAQEMAFRAATQAAKSGAAFMRGMRDDYAASGAKGVQTAHAGDDGEANKTPEQMQTEAKNTVKSLLGKK